MRLSSSAQDRFAAMLHSSASPHSAFVRPGRPAAWLRVVLAVLVRLALAMGVAYLPVANAFDMAAMDVSPQDAPMPCHMPDHGKAAPDGKCCQGGGGHCHCAAASCLPASISLAGHPPLPSDHPQTARALDLGAAAIPDTPPPRPLS